MINKKNLWFLTLFSLILVLSIYYVTMPNELLITNNGNVVSDDDLQVNDNVEISESSIISALKVEDNNQVLNDMNTL